MQRKQGHKQGKTLLQSLLRSKDDHRHHGDEVKDDDHHHKHLKPLNLILIDMLN